MNIYKHHLEIIGQTKTGHAVVYDGRKYPKWLFLLLMKFKILIHKLGFHRRYDASGKAAVLCRTCEEKI